MPFEQSLRLALRQHERIRMTGGDAVESDPGMLFITRNYIFAEVTFNPASTRAAAHPAWSSNSSVRLQIASAFDLSVR